MEGRSKIVEDVFEFFDSEKKEDSKDEKCHSPFEIMSAEKISVHFCSEKRKKVKRSSNF